MPELSSEINNRSIKRLEIYRGVLGSISGLRDFQKHFDDCNVYPSIHMENNLLFVKQRDTTCYLEKRLTII